MKRQVIQMELQLVRLAINVHLRYSVLCSMLPNEKGHSSQTAYKGKVPSTADPRIEKSHVLKAHCRGGEGGGKDSKLQIIAHMCLQTCSEMLLT